MDMTTLLVSTGAKIGFVLVIILTFAPLIIWAERRQSAMMQDRVGPTRADLRDLLSVLGIRVPVETVRAAYRMGYGIHVALSVVSIAALVGALGAAFLFVPSSLDPETSATLTALTLALRGAMIVLGLSVGVQLVFEMFRLRPETGLLRIGLVSVTAVVAMALLGGIGFVMGDGQVVFDLSQTLALTPEPAEPGAFGVSLSLLVSVSAILVAVNLALAWVLKQAHDTFDGRIAILGLLHPLADAMKFIFKEDFVPPKADKFLFALAPILVVVTAIATFTVVPFGGTFYWEHAADVLRYVEGAGLCVWGEIPGGGLGCLPEPLSGEPIPMQVASLNVGILYIFAVAGTGVVGAAIAGYASDNKYALLGGLRAAGQMVSYEVTLGLTLVPMFMIYNSLLLDEMVQWQMQAPLGGFWPRWGVFIHPVAFVMFFACSIAETKRIPFDVPEGESELVAGYFTEYSGMKFGMFFMGEFIEVVVLAAVAATIFFGGYDVPFLHAHGLQLTWWPELGYIPIAHGGVVALQVLSFTLKLAFLIWFQLQIRWTLPRFRYDQIMDLCWKAILPLSLASILVTGVCILMFGG